MTTDGHYAYGGTTSPVGNIRRGVWVPAFAGTTAAEGTRASYSFTAPVSDDT